MLGVHHQFREITDARVRVPGDVGEYNYPAYPLASRQAQADKVQSYHNVEYEHSVSPRRPVSFSGQSSMQQPKPSILPHCFSLSSDRSASSSNMQQSGLQG